MQIQSFGVVIQQFVPPWTMSKKAVERLLFAGKDVFASKKHDFP
jgi:predicted deacetylase